MKNHSRNLRDLYRKPGRTLEIAGSALPRWTPPYTDMLPDGEDTRPVLIPVSLEGHEAIGQPYRYVVQCRTDNRPIVHGHKAMYDPTNSLSDASTNIPSEIIAKRDATQGAFESADSAGVYWVWSGASGCADEYYAQPASTARAITTDHGTKYFYENVAFGKVAGTVNTGSPSSHFAQIWDIESRFMAFSNAQVVLLDVTNFPQPDGSVSCLPVDFSYIDAP